MVGMTQHGFFSQSPRPSALLLYFFLLLRGWEGWKKYWSLSCILKYVNDLNPSMPGYYLLVIIYLKKKMQKLKLKFFQRKFELENMNPKCNLKDKLIPNCLRKCKNFKKPGRFLELSTKGVNTKSFTDPLTLFYPKILLITCTLFLLSFPEW